MPRRRESTRGLYTPLGKRVAALARSQAELAEALGMSQQSVSRKLRGDTAMFVSDLEKLARRYEVHMTYFFEDWRP